MNNIEKYNESVFEDIKHIDEEGREYWSARELQKMLGYKEWRNFEIVIDKSKKACKNSNNSILDYFVEVNKMITIGSKVQRKQKDYNLSRYACYLIVQNANPKIKEVSLAQSYIASQTRKMELKEKNKKDFYNSRYKGLYNGETADDISKRKGLNPGDNILDNMTINELAMNLFCNSLVEQKIKKENIKTEKEINDVYYIVGSALRNTIKKLGNSMPEELPTPKKSLKELEKEKKTIERK